MATDLKPEPAAWAVYWGLPDTPYLHWPLFKTEQEALEMAKAIKSKTKVFPMYSSYQKMMQNPI